MGIDEKILATMLLFNWEQVEKQCSVTAPRCALKNGSNNLVCQRGTPALLFPAFCESSAILRWEQLQTEICLYK